MNPALTLEEFIKKAQNKHGLQYDYSNTKYINNSIKIKITCPLHGMFMQRPADHMAGQGCYYCSKIRAAQKLKTTTEQFIRRAKQIHNSFYNYFKTEYTNINTPVVIGCPVHGSFTQRPKEHLKGSGCRKCFDDRCSNVGGYTINTFVSNPNLKNKLAMLYVIRFFNEKESFIKVGITTQKSIKHRTKTITRFGYTCSSLHIKNIPLYEAFLKEQQICHELNKHKYIPNHKFDGYTECFIDANNVIELIEEYLQ